MTAYIPSPDRTPGGFYRQRGAATLLVAMLLLIATTLLILYTSQTSVSEQRMAANEVRAKQAQAAAQGGLDFAIRWRNTANQQFDAAPVFTEADVGWTATSGLGHMRTVFCGNPAAPTGQGCADNYTAFARDASCTTPAAGVTRAWVVACGWSDDSAARKRIITFVGKPPGNPWSPANPLTAGGAVAMTGNPTVVNYFNNLTIWSGSSVDSTGNNGKTVIRRPSTAAGAITADQMVAQVGNGNQVCNANQAPNLVCTTTSTTKGPDVIDSDSTLVNLAQTPDQYFENFLGQTPGDYKNLTADVILNGNSVTAADLAAGDMRYWVEGDVSLGNGTYGSNANPMVLVVNGNLSISGSPNFYGLIYVHGNLDQAGSAAIRGAVIVRGAVSGNGSMNIIYDPSNLPGGDTGGKVATFPGSWFDF